jgi:hypothetical protein
MSSPCFLGTYNLVNLLERASLGLREEEEDPEGANEAGREPNVAVLGTPVHGRRVDKVGRRKGSEPRGKEADRGGETERETPQTLRGNLSACQPRVGGDQTVVAHHVQARQGDEDLACNNLAGFLVVHDGNNQLEETADDQAVHGQHAAAAKLDDDAGVDDEREQADGAQHARHAERVRHLGHGEEVGLVGCEG